MEKVTISKPQTFPIVLKYSDVRSYLLTFIFIALSILVPWGFHQFHLAGATFLPMHIFVLMAGLMFGWRAGLIVGLVTPLSSNIISGMPVLEILPQIVVELSTYGLVAGVLREKLKIGVIWSLLGAMVAGRLALFLYIVITYLIIREVYSPLGLEASPIASVWASIRQGWPGIVIQLILIPSVIWLVTKFTNNNKRGN
jgi:thiamine transporter ThiT